jgi:xanthine dehydrogenase accessory factor
MEDRMTESGTRAAHDSIPEIALTWHRDGRGAALATVIETWGSAPRQAGSQLAISGEGEIMGSVSGGCVEGAVVTEALAALADRRSRVLTFGVSDETAFAVGLACGGTIRVLVEPVGAGPEALSACDAGGNRGGAECKRAGLAYGCEAGPWARALIRARCRWRRWTRGSGRTARGWRRMARFIAIHNPPLRLIVVGAVHIAQPLLQMARLCGYDPAR